MKYNHWQDRLINWFEYIGKDIERNETGNITVFDFEGDLVNDFADLWSLHLSNYQLTYLP